ncbi:FecR family protein [Belliella marina]|uniref:FecR family protein n=1 Tax=Belliella marina TaxID=1644146 RepID=A0ABW4VNE6_9BACT
MDITEFDIMSAKILAGEATQEEIMAFENMLSSDPSLNELFEADKKVWEMSEGLDFNQGDWAGNDWKSVDSKLGLSKNYSRGLLYRRIVSIAASVVLLVGVFAAVKFYLQTDEVHVETAMHRLEVPKGNTSYLVLGDGTEVWLNSGSVFEYPSDFNVDSRNVKLQGEAFFEVAKSGSPFVVDAGDIDLRVLGTSFNVRAFAEEGQIETTLMTGKLQVEGMDAYQIEPFVILPREKIIYAKAGGENNRHRPKITKITYTNDQKLLSQISWKEGLFILEGESLEEIGERIYRTFGLKVVFKDEQIKQFKFTGKVSNAEAETLLKAIGIATGIQYKITGEEILLSIR